MLAEQRREQFKADVAELKLKSGAPHRDGLWRALGLTLMIVAIGTTLLVYNVSLSQSDYRDIASDQILALAMTGVAVLGAVVFAAASVASVLRLWLLRQLHEGQSHTDQISAAIRERLL